MKKTNIWNRMTGWLRAFLILALVFLAIGLGTLGSVTPVGDGCALSSKKETDGKSPCIVLNIANPAGRTDLYIKEVYFNVGAIYTEFGRTVTIRVARGASKQSSYFTTRDFTFDNFYRDEEGVRTESGDVANWVRFDVTRADDGTSAGSGWRVSGNPFIKITVETPNTTVLINEIVFVANDEDLEAEGKHKPVALRPTVFEDPEYGTLLLGGDPAAIVDAHRIPSAAQTSFFRLGPEEAYTMMTISEMRQGKNYARGSVYHLDSVYNSLGTDLIALGALIFGMSPFGLRIMPFLASFGILVFGFLFVRKLAGGKDKAGFIFAVLYALCGMGISLGHFGTPLMIGLFFFTAALFFALKFFRDGMPKTDFSSAAPALFGGLFAAASICVNGAFIVPCIGIAGLFRVRRQTRAELDAAIDEVEADESKPNFVPVKGTVTEPRKKLSSALSAHRNKSVLSGSLFFAALVLGTVIISLLAALPMSNVYIKLYDNPESPAMSFFSLVWRAFCGGFIGENYLVSAQSAWSPFYLLFKGTGQFAAVTATGSLVAIASLFAGVVGFVLAILLLVRKLNDESFRGELVSVLIPLVGLVLGLATAIFAKGGLAFLLLAYLCLFAIAAKAATDEDEKYAKTIKILTIICLVGLAVCFGLFAVFTFSIPTHGFLSGLWA